MVSPAHERPMLHEVPALQRSEMSFSGESQTWKNDESMLLEPGAKVVVDSGLVCWTYEPCGVAKGVYVC